MICLLRDIILTLHTLSKTYLDKNRTTIWVMGMTSRPAWSRNKCLAPTKCRVWRRDENSLIVRIPAPGPRWGSECNLHCWQDVGQLQLRHNSASETDTTPAIEAGYLSKSFMGDPQIVCLSSEQNWRAYRITVTPHCCLQGVGGLLLLLLSYQQMELRTVNWRSGRSWGEEMLQGRRAFIECS